MSFSRLIRFIDANGSTNFGDLGSDLSVQPEAGVEVDVLTGNISSGFEKTGERKKIKQLLCPLPSVPIVECIGLNYRQHAEEAKLKIPPYPVVFNKPADALTGPNDDIRIHADVQSMLDYEAELTVVIGKDAKNVSEADALKYVLGYTSGNLRNTTKYMLMVRHWDKQDVSARNFQMPDTSGGQFCYAKSFDGFAPIGPCVASTEMIADPQTLAISTKVNGKVRQSSNTSDMIFTVAQIIAHLSRGTTLRAGTIIQTGTPSGVGLFMDPKGFLQNGDVVECEIGGIGATKNTIVFD